MIAGFDPSITHYGYVLMDETKDPGKDALISYDTFKTTPRDGRLVERLILQREKIRSMLSEKNIRFVAMEAPYWMDHNTELLYALNQFIHEVFLNLKVFVVYFPPMALKKLALPDMNPHDVVKHHMVHQAKTELDLHGHRFSEHLSDAYFAGKAGIRFHQWHIQKVLTDNDLTDYERHVFCGKKTYKRGTKKGLTEYTGIIHKENDQFFDYRGSSYATKKKSDCEKAC